MTSPAAGTAVACFRRYTVGGYSIFVIVMARDQEPPGTACAATPDGVPGCGTGLAGRIAFVARELADVRRELRGHARSAPGPADRDR
jgi:hypothetical protein